MIRSSACQPWQPDLPGHAGDRGGPAQLHHTTGHDLVGASFGVSRPATDFIEASELADPEIPNRGRLRHSHALHLCQLGTQARE